MKRIACLVLALAALLGPMPGRAAVPAAGVSVLQGTISGTVLYQNGNPAAGVQVSARDAGGGGPVWSVWSAGNGAYTIAGVPCNANYDVWLTGVGVPAGYTWLPNPGLTSIGPPPTCATSAVNFTLYPPAVEDTPTPTPSATRTVTPTRTKSATPTGTPTASSTPASSPTLSTTATPSATPSPSLTWTPTPSRTSTPSPTRTLTPSSTPTASPTRTATPSSMPTHSPARTPTPTATRTPSPSLSRTVTPTEVVPPTPTEPQPPPSPTPPTPLPSPTPTETGPTATVTETPTHTPTPTGPTHTPTHTLTPTATPTPTRSPTPTRTPTPTISPTPSISATPTRSLTPTRTRTPTRTPTDTRTPTPTITRTRTPTPTPSPTPRSAVVTDVTASLDGMAGPEIGYFLSLPGMGVPVMNTFTAQIMAGDRAVRNVTFTLGGRTREGHESSGRWTSEWDMSELQPGRQTLEVVAYDDRNLASPKFAVSVYMVTRPVWYGQPWVLNSRVRWSKAGRQYTFTCNVPNNPALRFQKDISFQYLGSLRNVFASDITLTEIFQVSGEWAYRAKGTLEATILGATAFYKEYSLTPDLERGPDDPWFKLSALRFQTSFELPGWEKNIVDDKTVATFVVLGIKFDVKLSVDIGYEAELSIRGRVLSNLTVDEIRITPSVSPYVEVDIALDILCGVATVGSKIKPAVTFYLPIVYDSSPPSGKDVLYLDTPCVLFRLTAKLYVKLFWGLGQWDSGWYELAKTDWPEGCAASQALQVILESPPAPPEPDLFLAPAVAADGAGRALALWVEDVDATAGSANPELHHAVRENGVWGPAQRMTQDDYWQSDPQVVFVSTGQALAVWTQNKLDRNQPISDLNTLLNGQELCSALWDGTVWQDPVAITADEFPDGRVSLAAGPDGQALAAWVHDEDGRTETRGDWEIHFALWDGSGWSAPDAIAPHGERADLEPFVAYDGSGGAMVVWVRDGDGDPLTVEDRRVAYARWDGYVWSDALLPEDWPAGVLWPSVAFEQDNRAVVVFTARGRDPLGQWYGEGLQDLLWSARECLGADCKGVPLHASTSDGAPAGWELAPVGPDTVADRPRVMVNGSNYALIVYRGFSGGGPDGYGGDVAAAVANLSAPTLQWGPPGFLTADETRDWQLASTVDTGSGEMLILDVRTAAHGEYSSNEGRLADAHPLGAQGLESLLSITVPFGSDLAIASTDLSFSAAHPDAGEVILITAQVHNHGFQDVPADSGLIVRLYLDEVVAPNLISEAVLSAQMAFNDTQAVTIPWVALAGRHEVIAVVDADGQVPELDEGNNQARRAIGEVDAPRFLVAAVDPAGERVLLDWDASLTSGVVAYRVYRSTTPGGGYTLVAAPAATRYADSDLPNGVRYYYAVSAVDASGTESPLSDEASAVPLRTMGGRCYLPLVIKS